jgi:hypothetical protein
MPPDVTNEIVTEIESTELSRHVKGKTLFSRPLGQNGED